jgi:hypothetical protein
LLSQKGGLNGAGEKGLVGFEVGIGQSYMSCYKKQ